MPRNHHKALKAKFDKFCKGYGDDLTVVLNALRTQLFGDENYFNYVSPI